MKRKDLVANINGYNAVNAILHGFLINKIETYGHPENYVIINIDKIAIEGLNVVVKFTYTQRGSMANFHDIIKWDIDKFVDEFNAYMKEN